MRLINFNLAQDDSTVISASSSNSNYPVSNLKHEFRNKVWRSNMNGTFIISGSTTIDFKESAMGSELSANVSNGTYTASSLATEIKNKLEAVGAETYTVTYSQVTGLWTITSGGAYFDLLNASGSHLANNLLVTHLGFAVVDKTGSTSYTGAKIAIHTQEHIIFDMITSEEVDSIILLWPKEDGIRLSSTAEIRIQANATLDFSSPIVDEVLTINNIYVRASHFFSTAKSYRYWRLVIKDPANPNLYITLGVIGIGKSLDIQNPSIGFEYELADQSKVMTNAFGNQFVDEYPLKASLSVKYDLLDYEDVQALENAYRLNGNTKPVFVVMDHEDTTFSKDHFLIYGKMAKPSKFSQIHYKYFTSDLIVEEIS